MIRFPKISKNQTDKSFISFDGIPFAKHNKIQESEGKQIGFLTEHTLFFILQGKKMFHFENETITVDTNQLILIKRGIYSISEYIPEGGNFEALMIFIPDTFLKELSFKTGISKTVKNQKSNFVLIKGDELLYSFRSQYLDYFGKTSNIIEKILPLKLQELFLILTSTDYKKEILCFIDSCVNTQLRDLEFIVKENVLQPLSISEFASLCSRSLASFKRDFKKKFGIPPKNWINRQRLIYANKLLAVREQNISEIAYECGFENVSHFIKIFKKEYGVTPRVHRAKKTIV